MQQNINLDDLRKEFDQFAVEQCSLDPESNQRMKDEDDEDEDIPHYIEELQKKLLAPSISGVYLTRVDLKRIADDLDESIAIKDRKKMLRALMRHTTTKKTLEDIFSVTNNYINGRILIYQELSASFPASKPIFDAHIEKAEKTKRMFTRIVEDFEEIEITDDPMVI